MVYNQCQVVGANNNKLTIILEVKKSCDNNLIATIRSNKEYIFKGKSIEFYNELTNEYNYVRINDSNVQLIYNQNKRIIYEYKLTDWYYSKTLLTKEVLQKCNVLMAVDIIEITKAKQIVPKSRKTCQKEIKYISVEKKSIYDNSALVITGYQISKNKDLNQSQLPAFLTSYLKLVNAHFKEPLCFLYEGKNISFFKYNNSLKKNNRSEKLDIRVTLDLSVSKYSKIYLANKQFITTNIDTVLRLGDYRNYVYKYELLLDYITTNYRLTNDICSKQNLRAEVNQLMKIVRANHNTWEFQIRNAKNIQVIGLLLLLFKENALGSNYKYTFPQVLIDKVGLEEIYSIANNLTKLRNHYAHNNNYASNNCNILTELIDELCYLVFISTIGVEIDKSNNSSSLSAIKYVALGPDYNSEIKVNKSLINKFYKQLNDVNGDANDTIIYLDKNAIQYKYYYDLQPGNMISCFNGFNKLREVSIDIQLKNINYAINTINNISLYPCIKGLHYIKSNLRFDQYIYFMLKLITAGKSKKNKRINNEKDNLIAKFMINNFKLSKIFISYIRSFNTIYDYTKALHGIDETLTDELIINGNKSNNNIKEHIVYIELLNRYYDSKL